MRSIVERDTLGVDRPSDEAESLNSNGLKRISTPRSVDAPDSVTQATSNDSHFRPVQRRPGDGAPPPPLPPPGPGRYGDGGEYDGGAYGRGLGLYGCGLAGGL